MFILQLYNEQLGHANTYRLKATTPALAKCEAQRVAITLEAETGRHDGLTVTLV